MTTTQLTLQSLYLMSDDLKEDFRQHLEACVADCKQRPSLAKKREVNLKLTVLPHPEDPDDVLVEAVTTRKTPARQIDRMRARRTARNQLQFDFDDEVL